MKRQPCKKRRYRTEIDAMIAVSNAGARHDGTRPKSEIRCYRCPRCAGWHITSQPLKDRTRS